MVTYYKDDRPTVDKISLETLVHYPLRRMNVLRKKRSLALIFFGGDRTNLPERQEPENESILIEIITQENTYIVKE